MIIDQLMADYDALRLVYDCPSVYRSNYSFDLRLSAANLILGRVHPMCSTKCLKEHVAEVLPRCGEILVATKPCPSTAEDGRTTAEPCPSNMGRDQLLSGYDRGWPRSCSGVAGILGSGILSNTWCAGFIFILFFYLNQIKSF